MFRLLSFICCILSFVCVANAQVNVSMHLHGADILIGQQTELEAKVTASTGQPVFFPEYQHGYLTASIEVLERSMIDAVIEEKRVHYSRRYTITAFDSALYFLPQMTFEVDGKEYSTSNDIGLKVSTVPIDTLTLDQPRPLKGVINVVYEYNWWYFAAGCALLFMVFLIFYVDKKLTHLKPLKRRRVIIPPPLPHKVAIKEMAALSHKEFAADEAAHQAYYDRLTDILRTYIEARFGINAREMTSDEIISALLAVCDQEAYDEMRRLFLTADLVKFAKHRASLDEDSQNLLKAVDFVQHTKIENPEAERPRVEELLLSDKKQLAYKRALQAVLLFLIIFTLAFSAWYGYKIYLNLM